eukprot:6345643-Pyramimonas_sp.AAC.1
MSTRLPLTSTLLPLTSTLLPLTSTLLQVLDGSTDHDPSKALGHAHCDIDSAHIGDSPYRGEPTKGEPLLPGAASSTPVDGSSHGALVGRMYTGDFDGTHAMYSRYACT